MRSLKSAKIGMYIKKRCLMTIQQILYAIVIAEKGSINKAAETLYISQPSLTSAIQELEKSIGIRIFNRT